jgi:hypothetical protein
LKKIRSIIGGSVFPKISMALALTISIVADLLDYTAAPLLGMPIIGDVFDLIVMSMLYSITKSKVLFIMNLAEFVPSTYSQATIKINFKYSEPCLRWLIWIIQIFVFGSFKYSGPHLDYINWQSLVKPEILFLF